VPPKRTLGIVVPGAGAASKPWSLGAGTGLDIVFQSFGFC
jgi:hypothetical protein